jgi:hypothetical protein
LKGLLILHGHSADRMQKEMPYKNKIERYA